MFPDGFWWLMLTVISIRLLFSLMKMTGDLAAKYQDSGVALGCLTFMVFALDIIFVHMLYWGLTNFIESV